MKPPSLRAVLIQSLALHQPGSLNIEDLATRVEADILDAAGGRHHIVNVKGYAWTMSHPITERFEGDLFTCRYTALVAEADFEQDGRYQVWLDRNALIWERT